MAPLLEPYPVLDIYSDGIDHIENLGGVFRTVYFTRSKSGLLTSERLVCAKIVRPISSLLKGSALARMLEAEPVLGMLPEMMGETNGHH